MKTRALLGIFCIFAVLIFGCEKKRSVKSISIEAEVSEGFYSSFGSASIVSPIEYVVDVKITNNTSRPIAYTLIQSAFIPQKGTPLVINTFAYNKSDSRDSYGKGNDKVVTIAPYGSKEFHPATNGYTMNLLRDAGDKPLQFSFAIILNNEIVAGPFKANLPDLASLKSTYSEEPKYKLRFF